MSIERHTTGLRLLYHVLKDKSWNLLIDNGILDEDFVKDSLTVVRNIRSYYNEYDSFPPIEVIEEEGRFTFPEPTPKEQSVKAFKRYKLTKKISQMLQESQKKLQRSDPEAALAIIISGISGIEPLTPIISFKDDAQERLDRYEKRKIEGIKGIIHPCLSLSKAIIAWENGTLNMFLGITGSGKSWFSSLASVWTAFRWAD